MPNDMINAPQAKAMPSVIYAKAHGASTDVMTGQRGLVGAWSEHPRDGHVAMAPKAQADDLRQALSDVAGILTFLTKHVQGIDEGIRLAFLGKPQMRTVSIKDALDAADTALENSGGAV